jgi:hypothetical protein
VAAIRKPTTAAVASSSSSSSGGIVPPADGRAYLQIQGTRPQTIGYALSDSPVFQLAWIAEKR